MKNISYIKDSDSEKLYKFTQKPIIFGRAIPRSGAEVGGLYYFKSGVISLRGYNNPDEFSSYYEEWDDAESTKFRQVYENNGSVVWKVHFGSAVIVQIPENFECDKLITDPDYLHKCSFSANNFTGSTTSPYYIFNNSQCLCIKPNLAKLILDNGHKTVLIPEHHITKSKVFLL